MLAKIDGRLDELEGEERGEEEARDAATKPYDWKEEMNAPRKTGK